MKMFEMKMHSALYFPGGNGLGECPEADDKTEIQTVIETAKKEEADLKIQIRKNNEAVGTCVEKTELKDKTDEELAKLLKQLAKNKKLNYSWTNEQWKCSAAEKKLAKASVKVFQQLLDKNKVQDMIDKCMYQKGDLEDKVAEERKSDLGINSTVEDIKSFYKAYKEYQNGQSEYIHLKGLMGFLCETIDSNDKLRESLSNQSKEITSKEISRKGKDLYDTVLIRTNENPDGYYQWVDKRNHNLFIDARPKDWKKRASFEIIVDRLKDGKLDETDKMLTLLGDYNLDGEVNSGDVGGKTGTQLGDVFRRTVATVKLENHDFDDNMAVKNLMEFLNIDGVDTVDELYKWMTEYVDIDNGGYQNTKKLQNLIKNLPIELGDVLKNGENAGKESLSHISGALKIEEQEKKAAEQAATDKTREVVSKYDALFKEKIKDATQRANITQQLLSQLPGILMEQASNMQNGGSAGVAIPLDQLIRGLSVGLNVGMDKDGRPHFGIYGARGHDFLLGHGVDINTGVSAGNSFFVPCESLFTELGIDVSDHKRNESLDVLGINRISLGANCTFYGPLFSRGVSAGYENNKLAGIEKQAKNINSQLQVHGLDIVNALQSQEGLSAKHESLKNKLKEKFPKSSDYELTTAADNLLNLVKTFKIDDKTSEYDKKLYARVIADVYSEMRRNDAINHISDSKWKLSGGKVGVQFLAGYFPTAVLVAKFTKYYNVRSVETEHSQMARIDAAVNGTENRKVDLGVSKEIGGSQIKQINSILKQYGAKVDLQYLSGVDGKPGRIVVPSNLEGLGINVRVSSTLKGTVQKSERGFSFPANTVYRLFQETGGNQKSITLNIGSDRNNNNDISISNVKALDELIGGEEIMGKPKYKYEGGFNSVEKGLAFSAKGFDELFTSEVVDGLEKIDSQNWKKFSEFMRTKRDATEDFNDTVNALLNCIPADQKYNSIKEKLSDERTSQEDKQLIVDRILSVTAMANVHDKRGFNAVVNGNSEVKGRGEYYKQENMKGPNGQPIFNRIGVYKSDLIEEIQKDGIYDIQPQNNLLGATAFYHKNNTAKGLAMTGLGATSVLGGKMTEIQGNDRQKVEDWFLGNNGGSGSNIPGVLDKSPAEWSNLKRVISNYIKEQIGEFGKESDLSSKLSDTDLKNLLKGKEIELDISDKKCKVKLDVKYMFYLMGECANESVGMQLGKLSVFKQEKVETFGEGQLLLNDGDGTSAIQTSKKDFAVGVSFVGKKKEEGGDGGSTPGEDGEDLPGDGGSTPGEDEKPIDPSTNPEKGEEPINGGSDNNGGGNDNTDNGGGNNPLQVENEMSDIRVDEENDDREMIIDDELNSDESDKHEDLVDEDSIKVVINKLF